MSLSSLANSVVVSPLPSVYTVMSDMHGDDDDNHTYSIIQDDDYIPAVDDSIYPDKSDSSNPSILHNPRAPRPSTSYTSTSSTTGHLICEHFMYAKHDLTAPKVHLSTTKVVPRLLAYGWL